MSISAPTFIPPYIQNAFCQILPIINQFALSIFQQISPHQFQHATNLVENVLEYLKDEIIQNSLNAITLCVIETLRTSQIQLENSKVKHVTIENQISEVSPELIKPQQNIFEETNSEAYSLDLMPNHCAKEFYPQIQQQIIDQKGNYEPNWRKFKEQQQIMEKEPEKQISQIFKDLFCDLLQPFGQNKSQTKSAYIKEQIQQIIDIVSQMDAEIYLDYQGQMSLEQKNIKKQIKKKPFLRALELKMTEEYKLNSLKYKQYQDIVQIKKKYNKIKITLFKEEMEILWLFKLTDEEIKNKVMKLKYPQIIQLKQKWREQLQRRSYKIEQFCFKHKNKIFYLCLNEILKARVYLCNKCMEDKEQMHSHFNHEIICKRHKKSIKYVLLLQKEQYYGQTQQVLKTKEESKIIQRFLCQQCIKYLHKQYAFVSSCHCQIILQLCLQHDCIKSNDFMICSTCQLHTNKHLNHRKIDFDKRRLMEQLIFQNEIDINYYQQQFIRVEDMLRLDALQKILNSYAEKICQTLRFIKSFAIHNNKEVEKWINCFMNEGKREDLIVLRGVLRMKETRYSEADRRNYLEAFNILMEEELQGMFTKISERVSKCCKKIEELASMNNQKVNKVLNIRYSQIVDIQIEEKATVFPMKLSDVNPIHYYRIQKIIINKQREEQRDQMIERQWREARKRFFEYQISKQLNKNQVTNQKKNQIIQLFMEAQQSGNILQVDLNKRKQLRNHQQLIQSLKQSFKKMNKQFKEKQRVCLALSQITSNQFSNLKIIHIQYQRRDKLFWVKQYYFISAFVLFKMIAVNSQLESVTIKAVQIDQMQQFLHSLNPSKEITQEQIEVESWIKVWNPPKSLKLALNAIIEFKFIKGENKVLFEFEDCLYFLRLFSCVSDIAVWISSFSINAIDVLGNSLAELLLCLRQVKNIEIVINQCDSLFVKWLLFALSPFTEISSLIFNEIKFNSQVNIADYETMEQTLRIIFTNNQKLTHLGLDNCRNFPALPPITTLQSIYLWDIQFRKDFNFDQFIKNNKSLRSIKCHKIKQKWAINQQQLNQLQTLRIDYCKDISFTNLVSSSPSLLKYLRIGYSNISLDCLKELFPKLVKLTHIRLSKNNFGYQLLSAITSPYLQQLNIWDNNEITDRCLQLIDSKWPYLRRIRLYQCSKVTEKFLSLCHFKSLIQIKWNNSNYEVSASAKRYLKKRGIMFQSDY